MHREGTYGNIFWVHELECGHEVRRKRRSDTALACGTCQAPHVHDITNPLATSQERGQRAAAAIAAHLGITPELVTIYTEGGALSASIYLPPSDVERFL